MPRRCSSSTKTKLFEAEREARNKAVVDAILAKTGAIAARVDAVVYELGERFTLTYGICMGIWQTYQKALAAAAAAAAGAPIAPTSKPAVKKPKPPPFPAASKPIFILPKGGSTAIAPIAASAAVSATVTPANAVASNNASTSPPLLSFADIMCAILSAEATKPLNAVPAANKAPTPTPTSTSFADSTDAVLLLPHNNDTVALLAPTNSSNINVLLPPPNDANNDAMDDDIMPSFSNNDEYALLPLAKATSGNDEKSESVTRAMLPPHPVLPPPSPTPTPKPTAEGGRDESSSLQQPFNNAGEKDSGGASLLPLSNDIDANASLLLPFPAISDHSWTNKIAEQLAVSILTSNSTIPSSDYEQQLQHKYAGCQEDSDNKNNDKEVGKVVVSLGSLPDHVEYKAAIWAHCESYRQAIVRRDQQQQREIVDSLARRFDFVVDPDLVRHMIITALESGQQWKPLSTATPPSSSDASTQDGDPSLLSLDRDLDTAVSNWLGQSARAKASCRPFLPPNSSSVTVSSNRPNPSLIPTSAKHNDPPLLRGCDAATDDNDGMLEPVNDADACCTNRSTTSRAQNDSAAMSVQQHGHPVASSVPLHQHEPPPSSQTIAHNAHIAAPHHTEVQTVLSPIRAAHAVAAATLHRKQIVHCGQGFRDLVGNVAYLEYIASIQGDYAAAAGSGTSSNSRDAIVNSVLARFDFYKDGKRASEAFCRDKVTSALGNKRYGKYTSSTKKRPAVDAAAGETKTLEQHHRAKKRRQRRMSSLKERSRKNPTLVPGLKQQRPRRASTAAIPANTNTGQRARFQTAPFASRPQHVIDFLNETIVIK